MPKKKRDYKREAVMDKRRGKTGVGSKSKDATRHRARRKYEKEHGDLPSSVHVGHKKSLKKGGSNASSNLKAQSAKSNTSEGGKSGNRKKKGKRKK
jgi:hypothetical protein